MKIFKSLKWLLVVSLWVVACSDNAEIPKLVSPESFDTVQVVQNVSAAELTYPSVDILLVIDGSGSMDQHQANVQANIDTFVDHLTQAKLNYHIAVTISGFRREAAWAEMYEGTGNPENSGLFHATSPGDVKPYFVTNTTPRGIEILKERIRVGTKNDSTETFFAPVLDAIEYSLIDDRNKGFFRDGAYFVPIFITDTEDQTVIGPGGDVVTFYQRLVSFKGIAELVVPYSVHIPLKYGSAAPCQRDSVVGSPGPVRIEEFLTMAGGSFYDLCAPDFGVQLTKLGEDLVSRVATYFELNEVPVPDTIRIRFGDYEVPNHPDKGWVYYPETNSIRLGRQMEIPRQDDPEIRVEFQRATTFYK